MKTNNGALILPTPQKGAGTNAAALDLRGLKDPVPIANPLVWVAIGVGAAIAAALLYLAWKKWRQAAAKPKPVKVTPPHTIARQRLNEALKLIDQPYPFAGAVSDAIREYLEARFRFHAPERTTEEFLAELHGSMVLNQEQKDLLGQFLETCDMVKFARLEPAQTELQAVHASACRLVDETEPRPEPPAAASTT